MQEDYTWQIGLSDRQIDDFLDLNAGEKAFMKLWNGHMYRNPALGSKMLTVELDRFVDAHAADIVGMNLYKNFVLHLTNLVEFEVIDQRAMIRAVERMQDRACEPAPAQPPQPTQQHCHHHQTPLPQQQQSQPEQLPRQSPRKRRQIDRTAMEREEKVATVNGGGGGGQSSGKNVSSRETAAALNSREATASVPESKESRTSRCSTPMSLHLELSEDEEEDGGGEEDDSPIISSEDEEEEEEKMVVDSPIISSQGPNSIETFLARVSA